MNIFLMSVSGKYGIYQQPKQWKVYKESEETIY